MICVSKDEIVKRLNALIDARKNKNCSRQAVIEAQCFKYILAIVEKLEEIETD